MNISLGIFIVKTVSAVRLPSVTGQEVKADPSINSVWNPNINYPSPTADAVLMYAKKILN